MPYQPPSPSQRPWLEAGYALFAQAGPGGLKIEVLARQVGKSKSSFYHLFADLEIFTAALLDLHLSRAHRLAERERQCRQLDPDLLDLLLASKTDLLFHRQLRIARATEPFASCLQRADALVEDAFLGLWSHIVGLTDRAPSIPRQLYDLAIENFYLRLTDAQFTRAWLLAYFAELQLLVTGLKRSV